MTPQDAYTFEKQTTWRNGGEWWNETVLPARHRYVNPGVLIHGNKRDPNNWYYLVDYSKYYSGSFHYKYLTSGNYFDEVGPMPSEMGMEAPAWDRSLVYNKCLEKLNSQVRGELDLSIALAEAGTTARMVKSLTKVFDFAKRSRFGSTKDIANGWLQFQYGWRPLVGDVFAVADESIRIVLTTLEKFRVRVTVPIRERSTLKRTVRSIANTSVRRIGEGKMSCTIACEIEVPEFDLARWSSLNPVSLGWELIPYSFVVDWFVDVGSYLRSLETAILYNGRFRTGFVSELFAYDGTQEVVLPQGLEDPGVFKWWWGPTKGSQRRREFYRTKLSSYPLPRLPAFKADLSSAKLFSGASLLRQLLK